MAGDLRVSEVIDVRRDGGAVDAVKVTHEGDDIRSSVSDLITRCIHLSTITRREDNRLAHRTPGGKCPHGAVDATRLEIDLLAQLDRRRLMTEAHQQKMHRDSGFGIRDSSSGFGIRSSGFDPPSSFPFRWTTFA